MLYDIPFPTEHRTILFLLRLGETPKSLLDLKMGSCWLIWLENITHPNNGSLRLLMVDAVDKAIT
jgi:hypothetical protein